MKLRIHFTFLLLCLLWSCQKNISTAPDKENIEETLQAYLDEVIRTSHGSVSGVSMTVIAPNQDVHWTGVSGHDSSETTEENLLNASQPYRIASVTKTFVATAILRLHEQGQLYIDHPIRKYISSAHDSLLTEGGYHTDSITIRHCLNHTSGLYDYAVGNETYKEKVKSNRNKRWTRTEQIALAMDIGEKYGSPGDQYHYSDTGYILLGEIIENVTGQNLGLGLRELIGYEKLGMNSTWLESIEDEPANMPEVVHRYFGRDDFTEVDPSIDLYGGGGLVSTSEDLATYFHNLFNLKVYNDIATLELMMEPPTKKPTFVSTNNQRFKDYRQGFYMVNVFGEDAFMHGGLWGTGIFHIPNLNCTIVINVTKGRWNRLFKKVALMIKNLNTQNQ